MTCRLGRLLDAGVSDESGQNRDARHIPLPNMYPETGASGGAIRKP